MKLKFWGVRGSIPSPDYTADAKWKLTQILEAARSASLGGPRDIDDFIAALPPRLLYPVGDNTPCVEISSGDDHLIVDAGSGLRKLGLELSPNPSFSESDLYLAMESGHDLGPAGEDPEEEARLDLNILVSHTHWDHIQGFPFFAPAFVPGNRLSFYGLDRTHLSWAFKLQQSAPGLFPIALEEMPADISFNSLPDGGLQFGALEVRGFLLPHPGGSLAFRVNCGGKSIVYATDYEFPSVDDEAAGRFVDFIREADILISDTQYTYLESVAREGWGHSTSFSAIDLAMRGGVKSFFLFHHDPEHSDLKLYDNLEKTRAYYQMMSERGTMKIELASEGAVCEI
jgi:Metal-dependent hydrolases of the beta-lactamase superfamily I